MSKSSNQDSWITQKRAQGILDQYNKARGVGLTNAERLKNRQVSQSGDGEILFEQNQQSLITKTMRLLSTIAADNVAAEEKNKAKQELLELVSTSSYAFLNRNEVSANAMNSLFIQLRSLKGAAEGWNEAQEKRQKVLDSERAQKERAAAEGRAREELNQQEKAREAAAREELIAHEKLVVVNKNTDINEVLDRLPNTETNPLVQEQKKEKVQVKPKAAPAKAPAKQAAAKPVANKAPVKAQAEALAAKAKEISDARAQAKAKAEAEAAAKAAAKAKAKAEEREAKEKAAQAALDAQKSLNANAQAVRDAKAAKEVLLMMNATTGDRLFKNDPGLFHELAKGSALLSQLVASNTNNAEINVSLRKIISGLNLLSKTSSETQNTVELITRQDLQNLTRAIEHYQGAKNIRQEHMLEWLEDFIKYGEQQKAMAQSNIRGRSPSPNGEGQNKKQRPGTPPPSAARTTPASNGDTHGQKPANKKTSQNRSNSVPPRENPRIGKGEQQQPQTRSKSVTPTKVTGGNRVDPAIKKEAQGVGATLKQDNKGSKLQTPPKGSGIPTPNAIKGRG